MIDNKDKLSKIKIRRNDYFFEAVRHNQADLVNYLLENGVVSADQAIDNANGRYITALHEAARLGHLEVIKVLLRHEAKVNCGWENLRTSALCIAAEKGHLDIVACLIEQGAWVNYVSFLMETPLMKSIWNLEMTKLLLRHGATLGDRDGNGDSVLHRSIKSGNYEVCCFLLRQGADPYVVNVKGDNCFKTAARSHHYRILLHLLLQFPYPRSSPKSYFKPEIRAQLKKELKDYDPNSQMLRLHAMLVSEKVLTPKDPATLKILYYANLLAWDMSDMSTCWKIFHRLLRVYWHHLRNNLRPTFGSRVCRLYWKLLPLDNGAHMNRHKIRSAAYSLQEELKLYIQRKEKKVPEGSKGESTARKFLAGLKKMVKSLERNHKQLLFVSNSDMSFLKKKIEF